MNRNLVVIIAAVTAVVVAITAGTAWYFVERERVQAAGQSTSSPQSPAADPSVAPSPDPTPTATADDSQVTPKSSKPKTTADPSPRSGQNQDEAADPYGCEWLAERAAAISRDSSDSTILLKVRQPKMVKDNRREDFELPTGVDEKLVMQCEGLGVFSDADRRPVRLTVYTDADQELYIGFEVIP